MDSSDSFILLWSEAAVEPANSSSLPSGSGGLLIRSSLAVVLVPPVCDSERSLTPPTRGAATIHKKFQRDSWRPQVFPSAAFSSARRAATPAPTFKEPSRCTGDAERSRVSAVFLGPNNILVRAKHAHLSRRRSHWASTTLVRSVALHCSIPSVSLAQFLIGVSGWHVNSRQVLTRPKYLSSHSRTAFTRLGRSAVTSCGVPSTTCFLSAAGVPRVRNNGSCARSSEKQ